MLLPKHAPKFDLSWETWCDVAAQLATIPSMQELAQQFYINAYAKAGDLTSQEALATWVAVMSMNKNEDLEWVVEHLRYMAAKYHENYRHWINLGTAQLKTYDIDGASDSLSMAHHLNPDDSDLWLMLSSLADLAGHNEQALVAAKKAAELNSSARYTLAMQQIKHEENWEVFHQFYGHREKPVKNHDTIMFTYNSFCDQLNENELRGRRVYVIAEQGLGDFFMMAASFRWMASLGMRVIFVSANEQLRDIAYYVEGIHQVEQPGVRYDSKVDYIVNMMDLLKYRHHWGYYPDQEFKPWLNIPVEAMDKQSDFGLNWTGNKRYWHEGCRGIYDLEARKILTDHIDGLSYSYDLLTEDRGWTLVELAKRIKNGYGLIITSDTMLSHLCGAMGKPCITMLPVNRDWRWYYQWYGPRHRTVVQERLLDWKPVVKQVVDIIDEGRLDA